MNSLIIFLVLSTFYLYYSDAQMIPKCTCSAAEPCRQSYMVSLIPCADSCQKYAGTLGASYDLLRQCLISRQGQIQNTVSCTTNSFPNACARDKPFMIKKRYPETLKIAAMSEFNRMLGQMGIQNEIQSLLLTGRKFFGCLMTCMDKKAGSCMKKLGCGLDLPSDNILVHTGIQCAAQSGFDSAGVQSLCQCAARAGINQLAGVCPKIHF